MDSYSVLWFKKYCIQNKDEDGCIINDVNHDFGPNKLLVYFIFMKEKKKGLRWIEIKKCLVFML